MHKIYKEYGLPLRLYEKLRQSVKYDFSRDKEDVNAFVNELP